MGLIRLEIEWIDSGSVDSGSGWVTKKDAVDRLKDKSFKHACISVGYLLGVDDQAVYLAQSYDPGFNNYLNAHAIYRPNILRVSPLRSRKDVEDIPAYLDSVMNGDSK